jgi:hypothetical protein
MINLIVQHLGPEFLRFFGTIKLTILVRRILNLSLAMGGLFLAACTNPASTPTGTPTLFSTETPTPTIVWFPPTNTPTFFPSPTPSPTQEFHPGVGNLIFSDSFDQPDVWNTSSSEQASAKLARNQLVLSINEPGPLSITSLRSQPEVGDFYAEAQVVINLCSGQDQYGMILRAAPGGNYYRFTINCNGQERLEVVRNGETYPLTDWLSSGDVSMGAPAQVKVGVWAAGREIRLFLNDHYQFSLIDPVFSSGTIGFYIYASGQTPITISFSNLAVYSVFYISPTSTAAPPQTPAPSLTPNE